MRGVPAARRSVAVLAATLSALALGACGGGGEDDEKSVRALFDKHRSAVVSGDVEAYCTNFSKAELKRTSITIDECRRLKPDNVKHEGADGAKIESIKIKGDKATIAYVLGGSGDKETGTVVKEDGKWKVSDLTFF